MFKNHIANVLVLTALVFAVYSSPTQGRISIATISGNANLTAASVNSLANTSISESTKSTSSGMVEATSGQGSITCPERYACTTLPVVPNCPAGYSCVPSLTTAVTVSTSSISVGDPVIAKNTILGYNADISVTISNQSNVNIFITGNTLIDFGVLLGTGAPTTITPALLTGDSVNQKVIPAGSSRTFVFHSVFMNLPITSRGTKVFKISKINYFSGEQRTISTITAGLQNLTFIKTFTGQPIPPSPITVTSPNGGETYKVGQDMVITWARSIDQGVGIGSVLNSSVYIELRPSGPYAGSPVTKIGLVNFTKGTFTWKIPANIIAGTYLVEMYQADRNGVIVQDGGYKDISDAPFTISDVVTSQPKLSDMSVTVGWNNPTLATNGSISSYPASFKFTLTAGNVPIYFKSPINITALGQVSSISFINELLPRIVSTSANPSTLAGDGSSYFIVPAGSSRTFTVLTTLNRENAANPNGVNVAKATEIVYRTDINSKYGTPLYPVDSLKVSVDFSKPTITLLSPNGGERYTENSPMTIRWNTTGAPSTAGVLLELHYKVGAQTNDFVELITEDVVPNTGSYTWTVPVAMSAGNNNSFTVKAILYDKSNLAVDSSNAIFTIVPANSATALVASSLSTTYSAKTCGVIGDSCTQAFNFGFSLTAGNDPVFISKNVSTAVGINVSTSFGINAINFSSNDNSGDSSTYFYIAPGQTKTFNTQYMVSGPGSSFGTVQVTGINFGITASSLATATLTDTAILNQLKAVLFH